MTHADAGIARQMAAARARRRPPQGLGAVAQDRLGWAGCDRAALRHDLWRLTIQLRTAHEAGRLPVVADADELTERALRTIDGVVGILWCRAPRAWAAAARRPFRLAWVLCDTKRGAAALHRQLVRAGRAVAPAARTRYLALQIDGQRTWGWAVPLVLGVGDAPWGQRWGYWDAPALAGQPGAALARQRDERRDAPRRAADDDELGTNDWRVADADRSQEDTPLDAERALHRADLAALDRESDGAVEADLARLEQELLTQWAAHGIDFASPAAYLAWSQACHQARRAGQAAPPPPAIAHYRAAVATARRDGRPRPVHPSVAFAARHREAAATVVAQASDAELAWQGRGADDRSLPEDHTALLAQIRRERAALWAGWDREPEVDLVAEGRRSRAVAQARALADGAAVQSVAVAEELAAVRRSRRCGTAAIGGRWLVGRRFFFQREVKPKRKPAPGQGRPVCGHRSSPHPPPRQGGPRCAALRVGPSLRQQGRSQSRSLVHSSTFSIFDNVPSIVTLHVTRFCHHIVTFA